MRYQLFNRNALSKISWLVDLSTFVLSCIVREQLKRYCSEHRREEFINVRYLDYRVYIFDDLIIRGVCDRNYVGVSRLYLFYVAERLIIRLTLRHERNYRRVSGDKGERAVL